MKSVHACQVMKPYSRMLFILIRDCCSNDCVDICELGVSDILFSNNYKIYANVINVVLEMQSVRISLRSHIFYV